MKQPSQRIIRAAVAKSVEYLKQMRDVRVLGLHVFVAIALLVTWSGVGVIQDNFQLQKRIARLEQENELQRLENTTQGLWNEYYNTDQYLELTARRQFGLAAPGEKLLLVPEEVALAQTTDLPVEETAREARKIKPQKPLYQRNFEAWMEFLFRRNADR